MEPAVASYAIVVSVTRTPSLTVALLTAHSRTLHNLWAEWQFGGGGRKPVKDFNSGEHGAMKNRYCFRKVLWYNVVDMVRAGNTAHMAIYDVYGENLSVTTKQKMQVDCRAGSWPAQLMVQRL